MASKNQKILQIALFCIVLFLGASCGMNEERVETMPEPPGNSNRSQSDFDFLRVGMSYEEITKRVGRADSDIGSGLHIMVYQLSDGKELHLAFASLESLLSVSLYNPEDNTREVLNIKNR